MENTKSVYILALALGLILSQMMVQAQCGDFTFHASEFTPSGITDDHNHERYPNDFAKTFNCDAPWRVESLDTVIPIYFQIEGTDADAINELQCLAIYDVSDGSEPPAPEEDFWGNYQFTPDSSRQIFKTECGGCLLSAENEGMYWRTVTAFFNDGDLHGTQADGTPLTARNLGYTEADLGSVITLTVRIIYEESLNWTDIHDQDLKIYLGKAPLPRQANWYLGDSHTHTWSSYYFLEIGASGYAMFQSQVACGLQWQQITDHAYNLTDSKWQSMIDDVTAGNTLPGFIALCGFEGDDGYTLGDAHHFLCFDVPDWIETYRVNPSLTDSLVILEGWNGFSYGAHTTSDGWLWSEDDVRNALAFDCFRGFEDYNERKTYESEDIHHPWGSSPSTGTWQETKWNWDMDLLAGINRWDTMLSSYLTHNERYEIFFMGGSDAHGSMNYHLDWDALGGDILYGVSASALGKVRNAVYVSGEFNQHNLYNALYAGQIVVTDGPFTAMGISMDGQAQDYEECDFRIADTCTVVYNDPAATLFLTWTSSEDYGDIERIHIFRGDETTDSSPALIHSFSPSDGYQGTTSISLNLLLDEGYADGDETPDIYLRAIAYTYDPDIGPDQPGDCSIPGYDATVNNYQYRAITNPIWINVTEFDCINDGDVNSSGTLTANDAQFTFMMVLGTYIPTPEEECSADCNGDNIITVADAQTIFETILGLDSCVAPISI